MRRHHSAIGLVALSSARATAFILPARPCKRAGLSVDQSAHPHADAERYQDARPLSGSAATLAASRWRSVRRAGQELRHVADAD